MRAHDDITGEVVELDEEEVEQTQSSPWLHLALFAVTAAVIVMWWPSQTDGIIYAVGVLSILLAHEFGHYFAARYYGVDVSLPYFLPGIPPLYTFGAFIRMRVERVSPEALLVIGAAGPLAGMIVAVPVFALGMAWSTVEPMPPLTHPDAFAFGSSALSWLIEWLLYGNLGEDVAIYIHPLGYAGWVGFFVTALNLVPIGQLDGGHIGYAMFGRKYRKVAHWLFWGLVLCGALLHPVWLVLGIFVLMTGIAHPPITTDTPLPGWCRVVGWLCFAMFVLTFMPMPIVFTPPMWELIGGIF